MSGLERTVEFAEEAEESSSQMRISSDELETDTASEQCRMYLLNITVLTLFSA